MEELEFCKSAKKGATKLFRLLYPDKETEGRSLFGQRKAGCQDRPGFKDKVKLICLEGKNLFCIV